MPSADKRTWSSFGEFFTELRENAGISLEELSQISKIQIRHLRNLEEEHFEELPPYAYVRGFITKCSAVFTRKSSLSKNDKDKLHIRVNTEARTAYSYEDCVEKLMRLYISRAGFYTALSYDKDTNRGARSKTKSSTPRDTSSFSSNNFHNNANPIKPRTFVTPLGLAYFLTAIFFLSVLVYLSGRFIPFLFTPQIELYYPSLENTIVNFAELNISGKIKWTVSLTLSGEEVYTLENREFEKKILLHEGVNILVLEAENIFGRTKEVVRRIVYIKN